MLLGKCKGINASQKNDVIKLLIEIFFAKKSSFVAFPPPSVLLHFQAKIL
jgi:hypothetical protein